MRTNTEIKIAIIIAAIMLTFCLVLIIIKQGEKDTTTNREIKLYKLYEKEDGSGNEFRECRVTTDNLIDMYKDIDKILNLPDTQKVIGQRINGNYRIDYTKDSNSYFIAFDADSTNFVYRGDTGSIYKFNSTIYNYAVQICQNT